MMKLRMRVYLVVWVLLRSVGATSHLASLQASFAKVSTPDLAVDPLLAACEALAAAMRSWGQHRSAAELEANVRKVDRYAYRTVEELLQSEKDRGIHDNGLKDPSSAMGLLWLHRALSFQLKWFELALKDDTTPSQAAVQAYAKELEPHHDWLLQKVYRAILTVTCPKDTTTMLQQLAGSRIATEQTRVDLETLLATTRPILQHWATLQVGM